ncbi:MAG: molybdopterin converting factor subunit 1 [Candidatus Thermoplasmatota archaeon]|nr:molybdopterin converting factor subunit 1 [Candidatus Thermoplasmatota archaeon]
MSEEIEIIVKFFAMARQAVGKKKMDMQIDEDTKAGELVDQVTEEYPELEDIKSSLIISVNKNRVDEEHVLSEGDEVAIMPPVAGG